MSEDSTYNEPGPSWLDRPTAITSALLLTAAIAIANRQLLHTAYVPLLYFLPMLLAGRYLKWWEICCLGLGCAGLREYLAPAGPSEEVIIGIAMSFIAYSAVGLLARGFHQNRLNVRDENRKLLSEMQERHAGEEQLRAVLEASPAAILGIDAEGRIRLANVAAHDLFHSSASLLGESVDRYLPNFSQLCHTKLGNPDRKLIECTAFREDGEALRADVWVTGFGQPAVSLIATIFDAAAQPDNSQVNTLQALARSSQHISGAFYSQVANLSGSLRVVSAALKRLPGVAESPSVEAMQGLVENLGKLSGDGRRGPVEEEVGITSLRVLLDRLRITMDPVFEEDQIRATWHLAERIPLVRGYQSVVFQVLLNVAWEAVRALKREDRKTLEITASAEKRRAVVRFAYAGQATADAEQWFQAFPQTEPGAALPVSRDMIRSFGGDLRYEGTPGSIVFVMELQTTPEWDLAKYLERDARTNRTAAIRKQALQ